MDIKLIKTEQDYQDALAEIDRLFESAPGSSDADRLEVLVTLVAAYESQNYVIPLPDPIAAIEFHMERLGIGRRELEPFIGTRARVSEILNRRRSLTMRMIHNLHDGLGISYDILMQRYPLRDKDTGERSAAQVIYKPAAHRRPRSSA